VNDDRVWTVYRYYDATGRLLYVGLTGQGYGRAHDHRRTAPWWPLVVRGEFEHFADGLGALGRETALIASLAPLYNRADNPGRVPARLGRPRRVDRDRPRLVGPGGPKRRQVEAHLATLDSDQLARLTAREVTATLTDAGMNVSERYVARILDQWTAGRWAAGRRGSGGTRRKGSR
jgi:hypothetical protein